MQGVIQQDIERLKKDPLGFAIMLDDDDLEQAIAAFFTVLKHRKNKRGDPHQDPNTEPDFN